MARIRLMHWNAEEWDDRRGFLESWGHSIDDFDDSLDAYRSMRHTLPDLAIISLDRLPSHGKEVGRWVRATKATRDLPMIFVGGEAAKVDNVRSALPDECFVSWSQLKRAIPRVMKQPPPAPPSPTHSSAGYSQTPLPKKLGIKPNSSVVLINAPKDFGKLLEPLPRSVTVVSSRAGKGDLVIWFARSAEDLQDRWDHVVRRLQPNAKLWVAWPKKTSSINTDLSRDLVREIGLAAGMVDFKICAINETYSGLCFAKSR